MVTHNGLRVLRTLGIGSSGKVKLAASDEKEQELVVIKYLIQQENSRWNPEKRALHEFHIAREFDHPHLVHSLGILFFNQQTTPAQGCQVALIRSYAAGHSLLDFVIEHGRVSENIARTITLQLVGALGFMHKQLIIHRDISMDNVIVETRRSGVHATLIDFGLAIRLSSMDERITTAVGEGYFPAPEVLRVGLAEIEDHPGYLGPPVDVWGLGVLLWILMCGRVPFDGATAPEIHDQLLYKDPKIPRGAKMALSKSAKSRTGVSLVMSSEETCLHICIPQSK
ncbi:kinase-like domain-containing protein [Auriculariales sp. MPI-PUGE-AT-0066]|nr:kinase-like domain-containing protein [Auriculariales sp. MPI-PUGE-AT-0066]